MTEPLALKSGDRVCVTETVERFPHFIVEPGLLGTVDCVHDDTVWVEMDVRIQGCEPWDNQVSFETSDDHAKLVRLTGDERIDDAVEGAELAAWDVVARRFPEAKSGDLDPITAHRLTETLREAVREWVQQNAPIRRGVFCPWAEVLCVDCNNRQKHDAARTLPIPYAEVGQQPNGVCDDCGEPVRLDREDVGLCQRVAREAEIYLYQTGGMCVAAGYTINGVELLVTDAENPADPTALSVGLYDADDCDVIHFSEEGPYADMLPKVRYLRLLMDRKGPA